MAILKKYGAVAAFTILSVVNVWGLWTLSNQADRISHNTHRFETEATARAVANCEASNESRQNVTDAFEVLIAEAQAHPAPNETRTPEERQALIDEFRAQLQRQFPQRDCQHLLRDKRT